VLADVVIPALHVTAGLLINFTRPLVVLLHFLSNCGTEEEEEFIVHQVIN